MAIIDILGLQVPVEPWHGGCVFFVLHHICRQRKVGDFLNKMIMLISQEVNPRRKKAVHPIIKTSRKDFYEENME